LGGRDIQLLSIFPRRFTVNLVEMPGKGFHPTITTDHAEDLIGLKSLPQGHDRRLLLCNYGKFCCVGRFQLFKSSICFLPAGE